MGRFFWEGKEALFLKSCGFQQKGWKGCMYWASRGLSSVQALAAAFKSRGAFHWLTNSGAVCVFAPKMENLNGWSPLIRGQTWATFVLSFCHGRGMISSPNILQIPQALLSNRKIQEPGFSMDSNSFLETCRADFHRFPCFAPSTLYQNAFHSCICLRWWKLQPYRISFWTAQSSPSPFLDYVYSSTSEDRRLSCSQRSTWLDVVTLILGSKSVPCCKNSGDNLGRNVFPCWVGCPRKCRFSHHDWDPPAGAPFYIGEGRYHYLGQTRNLKRMIVI